MMVQKMVIKVIHSGQSVAEEIKSKKVQKLKDLEIIVKVREMKSRKIMVKKTHY